MLIGSPLSNGIHDYVFARNDVENASPRLLSGQLIRETIDSFSPRHKDVETCAEKSISLHYEQQLQEETVGDFRPQRRNNEEDELAC